MSDMDKAVKDLILFLCDEALSRLDNETTSKVWSWFSGEIATFARQSRNKDLVIASAKTAFIRSLVAASLETGMDDEMEKHFEDKFSEREGVSANYLPLFRFVEEVSLINFFNIEGRLEVTKLAHDLEEGKYLVLIPDNERADFLQLLALQLHTIYLKEDDQLKTIIRDYLGNLQTDTKIVEDATSFSKSMDDIIYILHKMAVKWPKE